MDERAGGRGISPTTAVVAIIGLLVTVAVAWAAWLVHDENEDRLLLQRTREAGAVLIAALPAVEIPLTSAAALGDVTDPADEAAFRRAMATQVGAKGRFVSASVWPVGAAQPRVVVGEPPTLASRPPQEIRAFVDRATARPGISVLDLLAGDAPRIGYAATPPTGPSNYVVYAEQALPKSRTQVPQQDNAFAGLDYALYLGAEPDVASLVAASTDELPLAGRRAREPVKFADTTLLLAMSPTTDLGGSLLASLWRIVLGIGLLATAGASLLTERLQRRRRRAEELALEIARLYAEHRTASRTLQQSLLPRSLPRVPGLEIGVRYAPGVEGTDVGGDWYDVIQVDKRLVIVVGDVSGRGLAAASVMASLRYAIRAFAAQGDPPAEILAKINRLDPSERDGHFATVLCGEVDLTAGTLGFANAGHPQPLLVSATESAFVEAPVGPPIGVVDDARYTATTIPLPEAATLLLVTDGLIERRGETITQGLERLRTTATVLTGPLEVGLDRIVDDLGGRGTDDAALLAVRWRPGG